VIGRKLRLAASRRAPVLKMPKSAEDTIELVPFVGEIIRGATHRERKRNRRVTRSLAALERHCQLRDRPIR
jgi:hypothetical protein